MINQTRQQTKNCLDMASQNTHKSLHEDTDMAFEKMKKEIEANQDNALSLCTEKVLLARQAYDLVRFTFFSFLLPFNISHSNISIFKILLINIQIDSHVKRLDEDLHNFAEDLKQGMIKISNLLSVNCSMFELTV